MDPRKLRIAFEDSSGAFEKYLREESYDHYALFNFVARGMRFSYDYVSKESQSTSQLLPNGSWTGEIGLLNRSEVDYVPAPFLVTEERWEAVAFNYPYQCGDITFVTRKPRFHPDTMAIFRTLSASVWWSLFASIVLVTLTSILVLRYRYALDDVMLHIAAIALNQEGNSLIPEKAGEAVLFCTWIMAMALFTACFKSVLLSFLSFSPLTGVRNVPELAAAIRAGKYSAMMEEDDYLASFLQGSPNEDIRLIGEECLKPPFGEPGDLLNHNFRLDVASVSSRAFAEHLGDQLRISKDSMGFQLVATAVRKDFCCKQEIDMIVHRFLASGIDQKIRRFTNFKIAWKHPSDHPEDESVRKITLTDISGAFYILVAGYILSTCVLVIELAVKRIKKNSC